MPKKKDRCWEFMRCGSEQSCAAYPDCGEECWAYAGTKRIVEREQRLKMLEKIEMQDYGSVKFQRQLCKYIERYGMCQCCPYYQYVEKTERQNKMYRQLE